MTMAPPNILRKPKGSAKDAKGKGTGGQFASKPVASQPPMNLDVSSMLPSNYSYSEGDGESGKTYQYGELGDWESIDNSYETDYRRFLEELPYGELHRAPLKPKGRQLETGHNIYAYIVEEEGNLRAFIDRYEVPIKEFGTQFHIIGKCPNTKENFKLAQKVCADLWDQKLQENNDDSTLTYLGVLHRDRVLAHKVYSLDEKKLLRLLSLLDEIQTNEIMDEIEDGIGEVWYMGDLATSIEVLKNDPHNNPLCKDDPFLSNLCDNVQDYLPFCKQWLDENSAYTQAVLAGSVNDLEIAKRYPTLDDYWRGRHDVKRISLIMKYLEEVLEMVERKRNDRAKYG